MLVNFKQKDPELSPHQTPTSASTAPDPLATHYMYAKKTRSPKSVNVREEEEGT